MAVVESAADGLALTLPTLGRGLPRNLAHLGSDADQSLQIQLHHHYHHHHRHLHLQVQHHQHLLHQQNTQKLSHFDEDRRAQQSGPSREILTSINADPLGNLQTFNSIDTSKLTSTDDTSKHASIDDITLKLTSADGITSNPTPLDGETGHFVAAIKTLMQTNDELGIGQQTFIDGVNILADSKSLTPAFDLTQSVANARTTDDGKVPTLPIKPSVTANADPLMQFGKDSMRKLEDLLSNLNPLAEEFVPSFPAVVITDNNNLKKKNGDLQGRRRVNGRTSKAQREESIRRTVYVSDIDQQVTEEQLAALFITCGPVVDCRVCGDPNSVLRFAFVEFMNEGGARAALGLAGTMLGYYPLRVLPSKTAIVPVNPTFLPRSENEREMCARTVYCTNIDKKVSQADVKLFFEAFCGEVARLRLLGDYRHSTRIAFVEIVRAESAMVALNCSGSILGSLPLRVSPSKTPVRPRSSPRFL